MTLSNVLQLMHLKMCIHYLTMKLLRKLASYKVCLCFLLLVYEFILYDKVVNFCGDQIFMDFIRSLIHDNYEALCTWCLRYS